MSDGHADGTRHALKFAPEYIEPILAGEKDATIRYDLEYWPSLGDQLHFVTEYGEPFAIVDVRGVVDCHIRSAPTALDTHRANYPHRDPADIADALSEHYSRGFGPQTRVAVIVWENLREVDRGD